MNKYEMIQKHCKLKGTNIAELERNLGFARGSIAKIDEHKPSLERIKKICSYLDMPINLFVDVDDKDEAIEEERNYYLEPQAAEMAKEVFERDELKVLFDAVKDVPKEDIEVVIRMIEGLKK